jgi:methionyl-tRNA formyltransferase
MAGDAVTGVSIMRVTEGLDSGPVCAQEREAIGREDTYGSLAPRLAELGSALLLGVLDERPQCRQQDDTQATYADKIAAEDRRLDPARPAPELERIVRAVTPHIGANVQLADGSLLGVRAARALEPEPPVDQGELVERGGRPGLGCAEGALELIRVQPPGGREMAGEDYLRGHRP